MTITGLAVVARVVSAVGVVGLAGCGGDSEPAARSSDAPLISAAAYYETVGVGDFTGTSDEGLDDIGQGVCSDLRSLGDDQDRRVAWIALNQQADTELQSLGMLLAITGRYCPEYFHLWDDEVDNIMGGELPWDAAS